jgi:hypothetical protein
MGLSLARRAQHSTSRIYQHPGKTTQRLSAPTMVTNETVKTSVHPITHVSLNEAYTKFELSLQ